MTWEQITLIVGTVGGVLIGYLGYHRSRKVDAVSAQAGVASETRAGTAQVIEALNAIIDQIQEDNRDFREQGKEFRDALRQCAERVTGLSAELDSALRERDEAWRELAAFRRRFKINTADD